MKALGLILALTVLAGGSVAQDSGQPIDPAAEHIVWQMASKLAAASNVSFHLETTTDVIGSGPRVSVGTVADVAIERPSRLAMHSTGASGSKGFRYDGQTATLYHVDQQLYSSVKVPGTIDDMIEHLYEEYGFTIDMADVILSDPYSAFMEGVTEAEYVGMAVVDGVNCHHVALKAPGLESQIWIEDSIWSFPRQYRFVLTDEPGSPQFIATMSEWDYDAGLSDEMFVFDAPEFARPIRFRKVDK